MRKVNILGTKYTIEMAKPGSKDENELMNLSSIGVCDHFEKRIIIINFEEVFLNNTQKENDINLATTLRHEIIHAFLYESGLNADTLEVNRWAKNEEMIDWIAIQFPKILEVYEELGISKIR